MLLTVDIGTSIFKSAVWDFDGDRKAFASFPLSAGSSRDGEQNGGLCHEADSGQWLRAFEECSHSLNAAISLASIEALVISGNGPSLTPVLKNIKKNPESEINDFRVAAAPARLWLDRRAVKAAEQVSALSGGFVDASFYLPKVLDIKINEPELYEKTKFFLGCSELLAYALTDEARTVYPSDGFDRWFWNDSILEKLAVDKSKLPPFIRPGETFGTLARQLSARFGLKPGIPVISGGPDFFAAILGSGAVKPGHVCDRAGTSEGINLCTEKFIPEKKLMCYGHPVKPYWNLSGIVSTTGKAVEWACNFLGFENYNDFYALADKARAGAGGLVFLPYLAGERAPVWDPSARGILRGLSLSAGRPEFARSVLEGVCFAIRDIIGIMETAGASADELHIAGSAAGSSLLNQIKADITGKPVLVPRQKEAELSGLSLIGACALGKYSSYSEASEKFVHIEKTFIPDSKNTALYDDLFDEYRILKTIA